MRTSVRVFVFIFAFAVVVATAYWFLTYEPAGTVLLGSLSLMPLILAIWLARRGRLEGAQGLADRADADPRDAAGEMVGSFVLASVWPLVLTVGTVILGAGLIYGVLLVPLGAVVMTAAVVGMIRQSRPRA